MIKNAEDRGHEMMLYPIRDLPHLAIAFAKVLCQEFGMCGETLLTAWTIYAQMVEGLPCEDDLYKPRDEDLLWFSEHGYNQVI